MPLFFFHYHTPGDSTRDDTGCEFETLDLAYLDAYRSMVEIGAELLLEQLDPGQHRIEIADRNGRVLMELRFDEIFRGRQPRPAVPTELVRAQSVRRENLRRLRNEIREACSKARATVADARATLQRARSA